MNTKSINDKIAQYPILNELKSALILKGLSYRTEINYMDCTARFLDFIEYDNSFEITENHFRDFLFHLHSTNLSKVTINAYNSYIRFSLTPFFNVLLILIMFLKRKQYLRILIFFLIIRLLLFLMPFQMIKEYIVS